MNTLKKAILFIFLWANISVLAQTTSVKYFNLNDSNFTIGSIMILPWVPYEMDNGWFPNEKFKPFDPIINFLQIHPNLNVEISCHTDIRPIPMTNDTLSKRRADDIINYMISKGISPNRLIAVGYGSNHPRCLEKVTVSSYKEYEFTFQKGTCLTPDFILNLQGRSHQEAAHSLNRRTEMKILKIE